MPGCATNKSDQARHRLSLSSLAPERIWYTTSCNHRNLNANAGGGCQGGGSLSGCDVCRLSEHQIWICGSFMSSYILGPYMKDYMETSLTTWTPPAYVAILNAGFALIVSIYFSVKLLFLLGWGLKSFQRYVTSGITSTSDVSNYKYTYHSQYLLQV